MNADEIDQSVTPSGDGCAECTADGGWWLHLRRCATCGHVGCCDNSPEQHASRHQEETGHPIIRSFEPGETWFYDYRSEEFSRGRSWRPPRPTRSLKVFLARRAPSRPTGSRDYTAERELVPDRHRRVR